MAKLEYKKVLKNKLIDNSPSFTTNMRDFLDKHPDIKVIEVITHSPYHVTIIYQELIEVK